MTRKIVSVMTYNVSSGTLNSTIPYDTLPLQLYSNKWRTESGSHAELAACFPPLPVQQ